MKTYSKRIGFIVSYQTLIPHGGIGQFTKSFCELMDQHNIKVDIITDKALSKQYQDFVNSLATDGRLAPKVYSPKDSLPYTTHSNIFMYGDTFNYERMANFRNSIVEALEHNLYDALICNTYETVQVASTMGLEDVIQIISYTHLESQIFNWTKNPFLKNTNEMMRLQLQIGSLYVGTQSKFNQLELEDRIKVNNVCHLPIPITEKDLLTEYQDAREGILFVGRWEEGKNPELFIDLIEQTGLPAKVMTSPNGVKKFEERLQKIGATYDVRASIIGQEKVDFIKSSRIAFNPSTVESYGMAFYEQHIQLPTLVLAEQRWTGNFNSDYFYTCTKLTMAQRAKELYDSFDTAEKWYNLGSLKHAQQQESRVFHKWNTCFNLFEAKQSNSSSAKILENETVRYDEYIKDLNRTVVCIDDVRSALTNRNKFRVIYTDGDTYLTKDPAFEPSDSDISSFDLFRLE